MNADFLDVFDVTLRSSPRIPVVIAFGTLFTLILLLGGREFLRAEQIVAD